MPVESVGDMPSGVQLDVEDEFLPDLLELDMAADEHFSEAEVVLKYDGEVEENLLDALCPGPNAGGGSVSLVLPEDYR